MPVLGAHPSPAKEDKPHRGLPLVNAVQQQPLGGRKRGVLESSSAILKHPETPVLQGILEGILENVAQAEAFFHQVDASQIGKRCSEHVVVLRLVFLRASVLTSVHFRVQSQSDKPLALALRCRQSAVKHLAPALLVPG